MSSTSAHNGVPLLGPNPEHISISNSELKTYKLCKRKWWLEYYRALKPVRQLSIGPLPLGTRIHEALEHYYAFDTPLLQIYAELAATDRGRMLAQDEFIPTDVVKKFDTEAELGRIMLEGYLEWVEQTGADAGFTFYAAEQKIQADILGGRVTLIGKVDSKWIRDVDDVLVMRDYKSAASFDLFDKTAHMDEQTMMYQLIEHMSETERRTDGVIFRLLKKVKRSGTAKGPFYRDLEVRHNLSTLRSYYHRLRGTVSDVLTTRKQLDAGEDHRSAAYPSPSRDCSWICPFQSICPAFDDGSRVEAAIAANYAVQDPYTRYDETGDAA